MLHKLYINLYLSKKLYDIDFSKIILNYKKNNNIFIYNFYLFNYEIF